MKKQYNSESFAALLASYITMSIILIFGVYFIVVGNIIGKAFGVFIIYLLFIWWSQLIYSVSFMNDHFIKEQKYKKSRVNYSQIFSMYKNREGFAPVYIYVIKFKKDNGKIGKITFHSNSSDAEIVERMINTVNPSIHLWVKE
jgi:hypothetical protein